MQKPVVRLKNVHRNYYYTWIT